VNSALQNILQEQFLNKRIIVPIAERDQRGKIIPNRFTTCAGVCTFIGSNKIMEWELQVTVDGMPLPVKHVNDIQLAPEVSRIRK
jgi:hypothetical protein